MNIIFYQLLNKNKNLLNFQEINQNKIQINLLK